MTRGFFPLDRRLRLRRGPWSEGVIREAVWLGTTQPSFEIAAETFSRLTGLWMSGTTVWRHHRQGTAEIERQVRREEKEVQCPTFVGQKAKVHQPVRDHASTSIDGTTVQIRGEGGREVKMVSVSEVTVRPKRATARGDRQRPQRLVQRASRSKTQVMVNQPGARRGSQPKKGRQDDLKLTRHSYRVVLGDKAAFEPVLVTELARRQVTSAAKVTTVNDGGEWIWEMAERLLPPHRVEVLDWPHAMQNLAKAGEPLGAKANRKPTPGWRSGRGNCGKGACWRYGRRWNNCRNDAEHVARRSGKCGTT